MKKFLTLFILLLISTLNFAQTELKGVMGINFISTPSLTDYINQNFTNPNEQQGSFNSAVNFAVEVGHFFSPQFLMSLEGVYQINSYTNQISFGQYDFSWNSVMPSVLAYYVLGGKGYNLKFGGGAGVRFSSVTETQKWNGQTRDLSSTGFGFLVRAEGNTLLSGNLFANIGAEIRYDLNGEPKDSGGNYLRNNVQNENVSLNSFTLGVRLGIAYYFGGED